MSANDLLGDLFGSDSEDDDDFQPGASPPKSPSKSPVKKADANAADRPEINVAKMRENQLKDLFGSDDDEDDQRPAGEPGPSKPSQTPREDSPGGDGYYYRESSPTEEVVKGPPMAMDVPLHDVLASDPLRLGKLSNFLGIEPRPFDPDTYEPASTDYIDESGKQRVKLRDLNAIRWRHAPAEDGSIHRQSNARIVRWSDGSIQLLIGSEAMDIREVDVSGEQSYLYVRHPNLIQGQAQLHKKMVFRPASLDSATHKRMREVVDRRTVRQSKTKATATLEDPKKKQEDRARAEESRIKDKEKLAERQQKYMKRYPPAYRSSGGYGMLNAAYLEEDEDEYEEDEEEEEERTERGALDKIRSRLGKGRGPLGEEEEEEAVRRLQAAKTAPSPGRKPKGQSRGDVLESEEDEDISDDEDDDEMKDFIVDEEEDGEGGLDDDEGGEGGKRKASSGGGKDGEAPQAKRRAVVFDSDSE